MYISFVVTFLTNHLYIYRYDDGGGWCMEPGQDGDIELHTGEYWDVGLSSGVSGGRGSGAGGSVGVDSTDGLGSGWGVGGGCGDSDGAGSIGGSCFWVK